MEFHIQRVTRQMVEEVIPEPYFANAGSDRPLAVVAEESGLILGMLLFRIKGKNRDNVEIVYIYTDPDFRGMGITINMVSCLMSMLSDKDNAQISVFLPEIEDQEQVENLIGLFTAMGFVRTNLVGHLSVYSMARLAEGEIFRNISKVRMYLSKVTPLEKVPRDMLEAFEKELEKDGKFFDREAVDRDYCCFYIYDGKIRAYMDFHRGSRGDIVFLSDSCVAGKDDRLKTSDGHAAEAESPISDVETYMMLPAMTASYVNRLKNDEKETEYVILPLYNEGEYLSIELSFGKPVKDSKIRRLLKTV